MEERKGKNQGCQTPIDYLKAALIIIGVLALGFAAINQAMGFFYKAHLLKAPCDLCGELNPEVQSCIDNLNAPRASFPDGNGGWTDPFSDDSPIIIDNQKPVGYYYDLDTKDIYTRELGEDNFMPLP